MDRVRAEPTVTLGANHGRPVIVELGATARPKWRGYGPSQAKLENRLREESVSYSAQQTW